MSSGKHSLERKYAKQYDYENESDYNTYNNYDNYLDEEEPKEEYNSYNPFEEYEDEELPMKKIVIVIAIILLIIMGIFAIYKVFFEKKEETNVEPKEEIVSQMEDIISGYQVLGKVKINKINLEQYIVDSAEDEALKNAVGKLYGSSINNYGNFCIAGHNTDSMFGKLKELEKEDEIVIIDKKMEETSYKITEIYEVEPDDLKPLLQNEEKIEITLITCEDGASKRLIIKAEEF